MDPDDFRLSVVVQQTAKSVNIWLHPWGIGGRFKAVGHGHFLGDRFHVDIDGHIIACRQVGQSQAERVIRRCRDIGMLLIHGKMLGRHFTKPHRPFLNEDRCAVFIPIQPLEGRLWTSELGPGQLAVMIAVHEFKRGLGRHGTWKPHAKQT